MVYNPQKLEPEILEFWDKKEIYKKIKEKTKKSKKFYFVDGPPYTTGAIHVGHAWNKSLKDSFLRIKRMQGFNVHDQPGFDMHGLPIEVQVEKKLGFEDKREIISKLGIARFIEECEKYAIEQMYPMIKDFKRIGVWMDWDNPYLTIKNEYIEGTWYALKKAHENGFLYEGKKAMTWCPRCATALAKHELEYETVKDDSIFVKFELANKKKEFLIVWTTTPWTIPFNLAIMVNPDVDYVRAKVNDEVWILAKALTGSVIKVVAGVDSYKVLEEFKGEKLEGLGYIHPFEKEIDFKKLANSEKLHTVVLSSEYVSLDAGSGLVHCAPGCGPEDFEVGKKNKLIPFNEVDENGFFSDKMGKFTSYRAKVDDYKFIEELESKNALIAKTEVEHEYAHCWRCKTPIIYRTTLQWFIAVEKIKKKMVEDNKKIKWQPDWAGNRWFNSWLNDLQDWCISRQRFWGIPLPIWKCSCGYYEVIGTREELKKLTKKIPDNLHRPWIDKVTIKCKKCKSEMCRVEDILDVWMDSGAAPWAPLNYPSEKKEFDRLWPMDFILEGKDQIRGWFNSLMCLSSVSFGLPSYKAVYMHGMIMDTEGRKMSKSLKNIISPYEVIDQYGADSMRYYMISGTNPGLDLNYNFDDMKIKYRNLTVLYNVANYLIDYSSFDNINPSKLKIDVKKLDIEELYIFSKLNVNIKKIKEAIEEFRLNEIPGLVEDIILELSRFYMQLTREKLSSGNDEEKRIVLYTIYNIYLELLKLMAPITPFITESIYQELKSKFGLKEESIHLFNFPEENKKLVDEKLIEEIEISKDIIQNLLALREKAQLGVRWPLKEAMIKTNDNKIKEAVEKLNNLIKRQTNIKKVSAVTEVKGLKSEIKPDFNKLGPIFKDKTSKLIGAMSMISSESIMREIEKKGIYKLRVDKDVFDIKKEYLTVSEALPLHMKSLDVKNDSFYINTELTPELESEGFYREVTRRIQDLRKKAGLKKKDKIELVIRTLYDDLEHWKKDIQEKTSASKILITNREVDDSKYMYKVKEKIRLKEFELMFNVI